MACSWHVLWFVCNLPQHVSVQEPGVLDILPTDFITSLVGVKALI